MCRKVSVIMPTYRGASRGFLSDAIESVLQQTYTNFELLIVDDGSTDQTRDLCKKYLCDSRVTYIYQKNSGVSKARNSGIQRATGKYVCFLDDDDMWVKDKLEKQINFIDALCDPKLGLCYTALEIIDVTGKKTGVIQSHPVHGVHSVHSMHKNSAQKNIFKKLLCKNLVDCTSSVLIPRHIFQDVGFFNEALSYAEDYDLWLRIAKKYHVYSLDEPLALYRDHGDKLSANLEKMEKNTLFVVSAAIESFSDIDKRAVFYKNHMNFANYRFWLEDYVLFRRHVACAKKYGPIGFGTRTRFIFSYAPRAIGWLRFVKKLFQTHS